MACHDSDTAETFAAIFLDRVVAYKGTPSILRTDRDPLFVSRTWAELMGELRIEHKFSLAHHHQQQGQVERTQRTIEQILRAVIRQREQDWVEALPFVQLAYNSTPIDAINLAPAEIASGWVPRRGAADDDVSVVVTDESPESRSARIQNITTAVLNDNKQRMRRSDGRGAWKPAVGDRVYLRTDEISKNILARYGSTDSRLVARWLGPFVVLAHDTNTAGGHVEVPTYWRLHQPIAINRLKPCRDSSLPPIVVLTDEDGTPYVEHEIERIISHEARGRGRTPRIVTALNIRFLGYSDDFDRRIEGDDLADLVETAPDLVHQYLMDNDLTLEKRSNLKLQEVRAGENDE